MKKQKLSLSLGLVLVLSSSLVVASNRANASPFQVLGTTQESSNYTGGNLGPQNAVTPSTLPVPGTDVEVDPEGKIRAAAEAQNRVDNVARALISGPANMATPNGTLITLLGRGPDGCLAATHLQTAFDNLGATPTSVKSLINALSTLFVTPASDTPCLSISKLGSEQLVASNKDLAKGTTVAQNSETPTVNIDQLNAAINSYNKIVLDSSPETLKKLSQDPEFLEVGKFLKQLRSALKNA